MLTSNKSPDANLNKPFSQPHLENLPPPDQLLQSYRLRAGLTQAELGQALGLSRRMMLNWEAGYNLPRPDRLKKLVEFYLKKPVFTPQEELAEAQTLWHSVKTAFDGRTNNNTPYPTFDQSWFSSLLKAVSELKLKPVRVATNLPAPSTSLIGRERELTEIINLLAQTRLVTLTGPAGVGKTRLALALAERLLPNYSDGVWFGRLENVTERFTLISELAAMLEVRERPGQTLLEALKAYLRDKQLLLVLDNFEQLVEQGALLLPELLNAAPGLKLLVTSRELLRLSQEQEYQVEPLALPEVNIKAISTTKLMEYAAVTLFVQRAQAVKAGFRLTNENANSVIEICRKLDGLPLAIELAAARLKLLSPTQLLERLNDRLKILVGGVRDLPPRQQTLYAAIDWSYNLLEEAEKQLFVRLAIFTGGCNLESVEAVCNIEGNRNFDSLARLESLVNKSLLVQREDVSGEIRFSMLPTIHEYALEKLEQSPQYRAIKEAYLHYFLKLVKEFDEGTFRATPQGPKQFEIEYDNFRAALYLAFNEVNTTFALEMAVGLVFYWEHKNLGSEGRSYLEKILSLPQDEATKSQRNRALIWVSHLATNQGDYEFAEQYARQSLRLTQEQADYNNISRALTNLARLCRIQGDYKNATAYLEESLPYSRAIGSNWEIWYVHYTLGVIATEQQEFHRAEKYLNEALTVAHQIDYNKQVAWSLNNLGHVLLSLDNYTVAEQYYAESIRIKQEIGDERGLLYSLVSYIFLSTRKLEDFKKLTEADYRSHLKKLTILCGATSALINSLSLALFQPELGYYERGLAMARASLSSQDFASEFAKGEAMTLDEAVTYASKGIHPEEDY